MDIKNFNSAIAQIAEEKGISKEKIVETIEAAIAAAYKKDYGKRGQNIKAKLDSGSGGIKFWQVKLVVDENMIYSEEELEKLKEEMGRKEETEEEKIRFNPEKHIMIDEAKKDYPKIKLGEEIEIPLDVKENYGRIAAQTAKQVILQRVREAEKESVFSEYKDKEGEVVSGIVQRVEGRNVFLDIGKTLGLLPREEQVPGEFYRPGQRIKAFLIKVEDSPKGPVVFLSRAYPKMVSKLFELEVPEIAAEQIQIKSIAREPGSRSKIAVAPLQEEIDAIGSMVGQKGTRVMAVINELGGEKVDIIEYDEDPEKYIANSLSPAKVVEVKILPKNKAEVIVPEDQQSLAIGKNGQNVRLAANLTGWKIDVKATSGEILESSEEDRENKEEKLNGKEKEEKSEEKEPKAKSKTASAKEAPAKAEKEAKAKKEK